MTTSRIIGLVTLLWLVVMVRPALAQSPIRIAAASDLKFALDSIIAAYGNADKSLLVTYGSSGKLSEQIANGAPFHLFFSADIVYPSRLRERGLTASEIMVYGRGRLVLWKLKSKKELTVESLSSNSVGKIAIANPRHAPYGQRAVEALKHYGVYDAVLKNLVYGENVSQAAQFVFSGSADAGVIALSLALSPGMKEKGDYILIPEDAHTRMDQGYVVLKNAPSNEILKSFLTFLESEKAHAIFVHFGFREPKS